MRDSGISLRTFALLAGAVGLMGISSSAFGANTPSQNPDPDPNDPFQNATIISHTALLASSDARDMFGGTFGTVGGAGSAETGDTIFADNVAVRTIQSVTFSTANPVTISGFNLYAVGDNGATYGTGSNRDFGTFTLYGGTLGATTLTPIFTGAPTAHPEATTTPFLALTGTFAAVTDQQFRAEFTAYPTAGQTLAEGSRIIELDAIAAPEPASLGLLSLGAMGMLLRRRHSAAH